MESKKKRLEKKNGLKDVLYNSIDLQLNNLNSLNKKIEELKEEPF